MKPNFVTFYKLLKFYHFSVQLPSKQKLSNPASYKMKNHSFYIHNYSETLYCDATSFSIEY